MSNRKLGMSIISILVLSSMLLSACGGGAPQTVVVTSPPQVIERTSAPQIIERTSVVEVTSVPVDGNAGKKILHLNSGAGDIPSLDPATATDTSSHAVLGVSFLGVTRQNDKDGAAEPAMATSWDVEETADGTTYTFHLVDNVPWVKYNAATKQVEQVKDADGNVRMVSAEDFKYGILRSLNPETASDYAYILYIIDGAEAYNTGEVTDTATVGVTAVDAQTLQVKLTKTASFVPAILGLWVAYAMPQWIIEERGDRWTEAGFFQSYGPYTLKSWNHESDLTLIKNPFWPGLDAAPQAKIDEINWTMLDESAAMANYETGDLDVTGPPLSEMDRVKSDPTLSSELRISPFPCTYYYGFNVTKEPFTDARVRRAFSMAIDRQALIDNVTKGGQEPAQWFARPGLAAAPTLETNPDLGVKYNPDEAKKLLAEVYPDASQVPPITLMVNQVEGHVKIAEAITNMWKNTLGVDVQLQQQEWKVFLKTLDEDPPQIYRLGWCQDYPDAHNFDYDVFHSSSTNNNTRWTNPEYDKIVEEAGFQTTDVEARRKLYAQAEDILVNTDAAIIPIYWYTTVALTKPYVERTFAPGSQHYEVWDIQPH